MKAVRFAAPLAALATFLVADLHAQEAKTQSIVAQGLKFEAPASWKKVETTNRMRAAQLKVDPIEGDDYPAEMVVYVFPNGAGGVDANLKRWQGMFKDEKGSPPKIETQKIQTKGGEATRAEIAGHYTPSKFPGQAPEPERDGARLMGAILVTDGPGYFIRMIGPDKTMEKLEPEFDALVKSLEVAK